MLGPMKHHKSNFKSFVSTWMFTLIDHRWQVNIKSSIIGLNTKNILLRLSQSWLIVHIAVQEVVNRSLHSKTEQPSVVAIKWRQLMHFKLKRDIASRNERIIPIKITFNVPLAIFWDLQDQFSGQFSMFLIRGRFRWESNWKIGILGSEKIVNHYKW